MKQSPNEQMNNKQSKAYSVTSQGKVSTHITAFKQNRQKDREAYRHTD